ncbi:MAG: hypothetical protein VX640_08815 [Pseudomonadota bacterium]|nr:hypothetical protein [Pseudomonadota bacterium]
MKMPYDSSDLDAIRYLPVLRARSAELRAYRELRQSTRDLLLPVISVGKIGRMTQLERVLARIQNDVGRCFLDLNIIPEQACDDYERLCDHTNGYSAWREFISSHEAAAPVALLHTSAPSRSSVRQIMRMEREHGVVAIRSRNPSSELALLESALSAVDDVANLLIILDFGYIRQSMEARQIEARRTISALRSIEPTTRIAVCATSFPRSVTAFGDGGAALDILERDFHSQLGGDQVAIYGDHGSIYSEPFEPMIARFVPRIDYALEYQWIFRRRRQEDGGYVECASQITQLADWDNEFADECWGANIIRQTAGGTIPDGFNSPANWIAARSNMHMERQIALAMTPVEEDDVEDF